MPTEKPRYTVIVDKEMLTAIDLGVIYKQEEIPSVAWKDQSSDSEDLASEI